VLQLFLRCDAVVRIIRERGHPSDPFVRFLDAYEDATRPCDASVVIEMFRARGLFIESIQHDAHEVFLYLIDLLSEKYKIRDMFLSRTETSYLPSSSPRKEETTVLTLPCAPSLEECLRAFETRGSVHGWFNDKSGEKTTVDVQTRVSGWPEHLVVHLSRYDSNLNKIDDPVRVPGEFRGYALAGAVVHHGTARCGHYISVLRRGDRMVVCDDDTLHEQGYCPVRLIDHAYILLYIKIEK
jgi:ubiquitin C-terminal hydrolase